jgi:hypothetical protein
VSRAGDCRVDGVEVDSAGAEFDLGAGACDRRFVLEPPFLRLQVVAGAALLFFGHG